jgi:hypothetical protein
MFILSHTSYLIEHTLLPITKTNPLSFLQEIIAVSFENHTEHVNALCGHNAEFFLTLGHVFHITVL